MKVKRFNEYKENPWKEFENFLVVESDKEQNLKFKMRELFNNNLITKSEYSTFLDMVIALELDDVDDEL